MVLIKDWGASGLEYNGRTQTQTKQEQTHGTQENQGKMVQLPLPVKQRQTPEQKEPTLNGVPEEERQSNKARLQRRWSRCAAHGRQG